MSTSFALLFSGQGSQCFGMGRDVAENSREAMELWKKAERLTNTDLRALYWESHDEQVMADTRHLQAALTVVEISLWQTLAPRLERRNAFAQCAAGHSLGEYAALVAAGALSADAVLELVALRGALMAEADPDCRGAMSAVLKLSLPVVEDIVKQVHAELGAEETLVIANYNTPGQFVLSGTKEAIAAAGVLVKQNKGRAIPLAVSGAFHSPLMSDAAHTLATALDKASWATPRIPVYCNTVGGAVQDKQQLKAAVCKQMTSSVLWIDSIGNQYQNGVRRWLEIGPKPVLSKMVNPILQSFSPLLQNDSCLSFSVGTMEAFDELEQHTEYFL